MPRGKLHYKVEFYEEDGFMYEEWDDPHGYHHSLISGIQNDDTDEDDTGEGLNISDAADIWASQGMDEDYTFGYNEDDLLDAFNKH